MVSKAQIKFVRSSFDASRRKASGFTQDDHPFCAALNHVVKKSYFSYWEQNKL